MYKYAIGDKVKLMTPRQFYAICKISIEQSGFKMSTYSSFKDALIRKYGDILYKPTTIIGREIFMSKPYYTVTDYNDVICEKDLILVIDKPKW
jgi:hypothetical protein